MNSTIETTTPQPGSLQGLVRHLDLFSGIGGFALAAQMVGGIQTVAFCEIDPWARKVLAKNFPGVPIHEDVKTLNPNLYAPIELITGGYPCQPFSSSGKRRGEEDDRHLWPAMRRIIETARPRWVLSENVVGHITLGLDEVLADLDSLGYSATATVIPACAVDARHRRDRIWIVAGDTDRINVNQVGGICSPDESTGGTGWRCPSPGVDRKADGLPGAVDRNYGLGNAIVPQLAAEILRAMMRVNQMSNDPSSATRRPNA
jgi:DNA (cytosine-5)-methyltransferase 1